MVMVMAVVTWCQDDDGGDKTDIKVGRRHGDTIR